MQHHQSNNNMHKSNLQVKQELEQNYSHYLKEKKQLSEISNKLSTIQNKRRVFPQTSSNRNVVNNSIQKSESGNIIRFRSHPNSQLTSSLNLGSNSTKHSFASSPKVEQSPYLKNNKSSQFSFFGKDQVVGRSPKVGDLFNPNLNKLKTENSEMNPLSPAYSPKKFTQNQESTQKVDHFKLPPIKSKKQAKSNTNISLSLKQLLMESPYVKEMKKYEYLFQKRVIPKKQQDQSLVNQSKIIQESEQTKQLPNKAEKVESQQNQGKVIKQQSNQSLSSQEKVEDQTQNQLQKEGSNNINENAIEQKNIN